MERRLSYDELSNHFRHLYSGIARRGNSFLPIFSGDLSVALRVRHRDVKDVIEQHFRELQQAHGRRIQVVRYKRRGGSRAMRGYLLPLRAAAQLLPYFRWTSHSLLDIPEVLYICFADGGPYLDLLN